MTLKSPKIVCDKVTVEFPIYEGVSRSLRAALLAPAAHAVGSSIRHSLGKVVTIRALNEVSFTLEHGDRVALIGHNGAGKSTLLRTMGGVYKPTLGSLSVSGRVTSLFDISYGLEPEATGYENIIIRGMFLGLTKREVYKRIDEIVEFSELGEYIELPVRSYSEGMRLRLAFSVCTSVETEILLIDETIGVGDDNFVKKAQVRMQSLIRRSNIAVISSHQTHVLRTFCNKGILMHRGELVSMGSMEEVIAEYEARNAEGYITP